MIEGQFYRGVIYSAYLEHVGEEKLYVVVSNNARNKALDTALAARVTTSNKPPIDSIVPIQPGEPVHGRVLCDDIEVLYPEEVQRSPGAFNGTCARRTTRVTCVPNGLQSDFHQRVQNEAFAHLSGFRYQLPHCRQK